MKTTVEFLDAVKASKSVPSDYALAPVLGVTRSQISRFRNGKDYLGDSTAIRVAELLELPPAFVVACVHAERSKEKAEFSLWQGIAARFEPSICIMSNAIRTMRKGVNVKFRPAFP